MARQVLWSAAAFSALAGMAALTRYVASWDLSAGGARVLLLAFIFLCPLLLGLAIGVWGGARGATWGGRGTATLYASVVAWTWVQEGVFPVGFQFPLARYAALEIDIPAFVTLLNVVVFLITLYFMRTLGVSGGRLAVYVTRSKPHALPPAASSPGSDRNGV